MMLLIAFYAAVLFITAWSVSAMFRSDFGRSQTAGLIPPHDRK